MSKFRILPVIPTKDSFESAEPDERSWLTKAYLAVIEGWRFVLICSVAALVLGGAYLWLQKPRYTIEMEVIPITQDESLDPNGMSSKLSLVSLATRGGGNGNFSVYLDALESLPIAERLEAHYSEMQVVQQVDGGMRAEWDSGTQRWVPRGGIGSLVRNTLSGIFGQGLSWTPPTPQRLSEYLNRMVTVGAPDRDTQIVTVTMTHEDPEFAKQLLLRMHQEAEGYLRDRALQQVNAYMAYLTEKLRTVTVSDYRDQMLQLMLSQEHRRMVVASNTPRVAAIYSGPVASERPTTPKVGLTLAVALLGGLGIAVLTLLWRLGLIRLPSPSEQPLIE